MLYLEHELPVQHMCAQQDNLRDLDTGLDLYSTCLLNNFAHIAKFHRWVLWSALLACIYIYMSVALHLYLYV